MTQQEKAEELVNKFYNYVFNPESHKDDNLNWAKQCALISVDECLNTCVESMIYYWQEVKQEIEKL